MSVTPLGYVKVAAAGTPVQVTSGLAQPSNRIAGQTLMVQAIPGNSGKIFLGFANMVKATGVGVLAVLPIPTLNILPSTQISLPMLPAGLNIADFYLDADVNGEGAIVSYTTG